MAFPVIDPAAVRREALAQVELLVRHTRGPMPSFGAPRTYSVQAETTIEELHWPAGAGEDAGALLVEADVTVYAVVDLTDRDAPAITVTGVTPTLPMPYFLQALLELEAIRQAGIDGSHLEESLVEAAKDAAASCAPPRRRIGPEPGYWDAA